VLHGGVIDTVDAVDSVREAIGAPLVVLSSPYRSLLRPLIDYVESIQSRGDDQMVTVVLPEFLPGSGGSTSSTTRRR